MPRRQAHHPLAVFTPGKMAQSLRRKVPQEQPPNRPRVGSSRNPTVVVDIASVARGAVVVGEFFLRRAQNKKLRQHAVRELALELAREFQGFVGIPDLRTRDRDLTRDDAERCLSGLEDEQICRFLCHYQDEPLYVFPAFLARVWQCEYCASSFAVGPETRQLAVCGCPNCGAAMRQRLAEAESTTDSPTAC